MAPWEINGPLGNKWPSWEISGTVLGNKRQEINGPPKSWEITGWEITGGDPFWGINVKGLSEKQSSVLMAVLKLGMNVLVLGVIPSWF